MSDSDPKPRARFDRPERPAEQKAGYGTYRAIILDFLDLPASDYPEAVVRLDDETIGVDKLYRGLYQASRAAALKDKVKVVLRDGEPVVIRLAGAK